MCTLLWSSVSYYLYACAVFDSRCTLLRQSEDVIMMCPIEIWKATTSTTTVETTTVAPTTAALLTTFKPTTTIAHRTTLATTTPATSTPATTTPATTKSATTTPATTEATTTTLATTTPATSTLATTTVATTTLATSTLATSTPATSTLATTTVAITTPRLATTTVATTTPRLATTTIATTTPRLATTTVATTTPATTTAVTSTAKATTTTKLVRTTTELIPEPSTELETTSAPLRTTTLRGLNATTTSSQNMLDFHEDNIQNYNWLFFLFMFFVVACSSIGYIVKKFKSKAVHPKQVKIKCAEKKSYTTEQVQEKIRKIQDQNKSKNNEKCKMLENERYKIFLKKKYPDLEYAMADQFYKNSKLMNKLKKQLKESKIVKKKTKKTLNINEIPTERVDFITHVKIHDKKPKIDTVAAARVKSDRILKMMREKKLVQNSVFKK